MGSWWSVAEPPSEPAKGHLQPGEGVDPNRSPPKCLRTPHSAFAGLRVFPPQSSLKLTGLSGHRWPTRLWPRSALQAKRSWGPKTYQEPVPSPVGQRSAGGPASRAGGPANMGATWVGSVLGYAGLCWALAGRASGVAMTPQRLAAASPSARVMARPGPLWSLSKTRATSSSISCHVRFFRQQDGKSKPLPHLPLCSHGAFTALRTSPPARSTRALSWPKSRQTFTLGQVQGSARQCKAGLWARGLVIRSGENHHIVLRDDIHVRQINHCWDIAVLASSHVTSSRTQRLSPAFAVHSAVPFQRAATASYGGQTNWLHQNESSSDP